MTNSGFRLSPQELRQAADSLDDYARSLRSLTKSVSDTIDGTSPQWLGSSAQRLLTRYQQTRTVIEGYPARYEALALYLRQTADDFELADRAQQPTVQVTLAPDVKTSQDVENNLKRRLLYEEINDARQRIDDLYQDRIDLVEDRTASDVTGGVLGTIAVIGGVAALACPASAGAGCVIAGAAGLIVAVGGLVKTTYDHDMLTSRIEEIDREIEKLERQIDEYEQEMNSTSMSPSPARAAVVSLQPHLAGLDYLAA